MIQTIILSGQSGIPISPLIQSAIRSELRSVELSIQRTQYRLSCFENEYHMSSDDFKKGFEAGKISESPDFIEWFGEIKTLAILNARKQALTRVNFADGRIFPTNFRDHRQLSRDSV